jgi:hypothetical protein
MPNGLGRARRVSLYREPAKTYSPSQDVINPDNGLSPPRESGKVCTQLANARERLPALYGERVALSAVQDFPGRPSAFAGMTTGGRTLVLQLQHCAPFFPLRAAGVGLQRAVQHSRLVDRVPRSELSEMERRASIGRWTDDGPQCPRPSAMPWLRVVNHPGDDILPRPVQHLQNVRMGRVRIIVKEFDPPVTFAAHLPGGVQDDPLKHLSALYGLDCADQAMTTLRIAQPAFAPLLFGREQALHRAELCELDRSIGFYSVERHLMTPLYIVAAYLAPAPVENLLLCLALILTLGRSSHSGRAENFPRKAPAVQPRTIAHAATMRMSKHRA